MAMNLHMIASSVIGAVNPSQPVSLQFSIGYSTGSNLQRTPQYEMPFGALFTGALNDGILTVSAVSMGVLAVGQMLVGNYANKITGNTTITEQLTGTPGGAGTYAVTGTQVTSSGTLMATAIWGQVQQLTTRDLMHLDALNIQNSTRKMYLNGHVDAIVRMSDKGGDLISIANGTVWLTTAVLERWPDWCAVAMTLQNRS
jgi:hypothetical protein